MSDAALATREQSLAPRGPSVIEDLKLAPVEKQKVALAEYSRRRACFYEWLTSNLKEDVQYGYPPGTRRPEQKGYKSKPSLYKAGALLICDLLRLRPTFCADVETWKMLGAQPGSFAIRCDLLDENGVVIGSGRGIFEAGEKKMPANSAMKMAQKRALVDAVITAVPVAGDLFTQDLEDLPEATGSANGKGHHVAAAKAKVATAEQLAQLKDLATHSLMPEDKVAALKAAIARGLTEAQAAALIAKAETLLSDIVAEVHRKAAEDEPGEPPAQREPGDEDPDTMPAWSE